MYQEADKASILGRKFKKPFISVDRVGNFGDFNVLGFVLFSSLLLLRCVARFLRWILCFQTFVLMMYLLTVLGDGRRNDEKIGIVSKVGFMGEFIKCWTLLVHGCIYVRLCESDKGSVWWSCLKCMLTFQSSFQFEMYFKLNF